MELSLKKFRDLYDTLSVLLSDEDHCKDLEECGLSVVSLFNTILNSTLSNTEKLSELLLKVDSLVDYCNDSILLYHFKDVPVYWRRCLMDSGLLKTLVQLKGLGEMKKADFKTVETQVQFVMSDLDTCSVISGAPNRRAITQHLLEELQTWLTNGRHQDKPAVFKNLKKPAQPNRPHLTHPIERLPEPPSFEWFLNHCQKTVPTPFIMPKGVIDYWPAFEEHPWKSMDYLLSIAADRVVPVEIGSQYTDSDWKQQMMRFSDFIQDHVLDPKTPVAYLAQHDLFYQIPPLERDILIPDYCFIETELNEFYQAKPNDVLKNAWFGPKGTISPLHQDPYHNLLCQVVGSKYIRLISPLNTSSVYPRDGLMNNTSEVDIDNFDEEKFPLFKDVEYVECILEEGEVLYIPPKWWHYVKSLETSFSVSLWF